MRYFTGKSRHMLAGALIGMLALGMQDARAQEGLDLSVEQAGRIRVEKLENRAEGLQGAQFVKPGALTVGVSTSSSLPLHDYAADARTVIGYDIDLAYLVADSLGLELRLVEVSWADWPLGLVSGKFDAVISNVTVTEERKEKFDFATYRNDVLGFYVRMDSPVTEIKEAKDIAGLRVITDSGTNQEKVLLEWDRQNVKAGLKPVEVQYYDDRGLGELALLSGRADLVFSVNTLQAYIAAKGKTRLVGLVSGGWPQTAEVAVAFRKGNGLAEPVTHILNDRIADGTYQKVLIRWKLAEEAITQSRTNPPGLSKDIF
ncbi:MAG: ABC transporter substrate-binding protein [Candidatus Tokpelaia hoelldobleri]|uniref:ABC transporter substrate-binding protein n=1 Tax=Candidatus Tokpelaia hoelldobleri TaxID=1902579 RepID=A0A1U9JT36_9HYPH|nr:MAG: ABC transporter substrate-binding protein [Candidatus Tokpelaia hoelldoblerii]